MFHTSRDIRPRVRDPSRTFAWDTPRPENQKAVDLNAPPQPAPPTTIAVAALLMCWENEEDGFWRELDRLGKVLEVSYSVSVHRFQIPHVNSKAAVEEKIDECQRTLEGPKPLLIVGYMGHAGMSGRGTLKLVGQSRRRATRGSLPWDGAWSPGLDWSEIQTKLEQMDLDVIILLDACQTGGAIAMANPGASRRRTEMLTACGYHENTLTPAMDRGNISELQFFTKAVTKELQRRAATGQSSQPAAPFTLASFHSGLVRNIIREGYLENCDVAVPSPAYFCITESIVEPSISLTPRSARIIQQGNGGVERDEVDVSG